MLNFLNLVISIIILYLIYKNFSNLVIVILLLSLIISINSNLYIIENFDNDKSNNEDDCVHYDEDFVELRSRYIKDLNLNMRPNSPGVSNYVNTWLNYIF